MQYKNLESLPQTIQRAILEDDYDRGERTDVSVTQLIDSPRIFMLKRLYKEYIIEDARSQVQSLIGRAVHKYLESYTRAPDIAEERLYTDIDGIVLSGSIDLQEFTNDGIIIHDYKTWKVAQLNYEHSALEKQLNCYAYLAHRNGKKVSGLKGIIILKDWSQEGIKKSIFYPKTPVFEIAVPLWKIEEQERFIKQCITPFRSVLGNNTEQNELVCSVSERWGSNTKIFYEGGDTNTYEYSEEIPYEQQMVVQRVVIGRNRRCEGYCPVAPYCSQWKRIQELNDKLKSISKNKRSKKASKLYTERNE